MSNSKQPKPFVNHSDFAQPDIEAELFAQPLPALPPAYCFEAEARLCSGVVVLSRAEERKVFLQYNYARLRQHMANSAAVSPWAERAQHLREYLVRNNCGLVRAALSRNQLAVDADEAFSEGIAALLRAVDNFDVTHGFKFSSYATQCISNALSFCSTKASKRAKRLPTTELNAIIGGQVVYNATPADDIADLRDALAANTAGLTAQERYVVEHRYFNSQVQQKDLATLLGFNAETVRKIERRALDKLRTVLS